MNEVLNSMTENGRLMVMAGGTGGHVFPALAVANELREQGTKVTWLGTQRGLEARLVPNNGFDIEWVSVSGLRGKGILSWFLAPFKLLRAMAQSASAIQRIQPDCVLGMGGFVAGPGGLMARIMGKPLIIHEQNAVAGLTNKYLARVANHVLTGFPSVAGLPDSARWVGNPVRKDISPSNDELSSAEINVLVIGGSQGALSFNQKLASVFAQQTVGINIWHQSGKGRSAPVIASYQQEGVTAKVTEFIEDMVGAYQWADILICRAGAMTIAECCATATPALLVPYPFSAGDHQALNAQAMVDVGAAQMLNNQDLDKPIMVTTLAGMLAEKTKLTSMGQAALSLHKANAVSSVVRVCAEYCHA